MQKLIHGAVCRPLRGGRVAVHPGRSNYVSIYAMPGRVTLKLYVLGPLGRVSMNAPWNWSPGLIWFPGLMILWATCIAFRTGSAPRACGPAVAPED